MQFQVSLRAAVVAAALAGFVAPAAMAQDQGNAPASTSSAPASSAPAAKPKNSDPVICKEDEADLGSRIGSHRECHRKSEWDQMSHDAHDALQGGHPK